MWSGTESKTMSSAQSLWTDIRYPFYWNLRSIVVCGPERYIMVDMTMADAPLP